MKLSVVIGFITGFGSIIPYFGAVIGGALTAVMVSVDFAGWNQVFWVVMVFIGVEVLDGVFITPKLLGDKVGLSPVAVIVALLVAGQLFGFAGVLLAVPMAAVVRILVRRAVEAYRGTTFFSGPTDRPVPIHTSAEIEDYVKQARCPCGGSFKIEEQTSDGATLICSTGGEVRVLVVRPVGAPALPPVAAESKPALAAARSETPPSQATTRERPAGEGARPHSEPTVKVKAATTRKTPLTEVPTPTTADSRAQTIRRKPRPEPVKPKPVATPIAPRKMPRRSRSRSRSRSPRRHP